MKKLACICNRILFSPEKEWDLSICHSVDGPAGHYVKCNKSETKRKVLHYLTDTENLKKFSCTEIEKKAARLPGMELGME